MNADSLGARVLVTKVITAVLRPLSKLVCLALDVAHPTSDDTSIMLPPEAFPISYSLVQSQG